MYRLFTEHYLYGDYSLIRAAVYLTPTLSDSYIPAIGLYVDTKYPTVVAGDADGDASANPGHVAGWDDVGIYEGSYS